MTSSQKEWQGFFNKNNWVRFQGRSTYRGENKQVAAIFLGPHHPENMT